MKDKLKHKPLLQLPNFGKTFELESDTSGVDIDGVLIQDTKLVAYFSEKLNMPYFELFYVSYDKELYVLNALAHPRGRHSAAAYLRALRQVGAWKGGGEAKGAA